MMHQKADTLADRVDEVLINGNLPTATQSDYNAIDGELIPVIAPHYSGASNGATGMCCRKPDQHIRNV